MLIFVYPIKSLIRHLLRIPSIPRNYLSAGKYLYKNVTNYKIYYD